MQKLISSSEVRPFLRWAGGKGWARRHVLDITQNLEFKSYHEPFLGGGAMFFAFRPNAAFLSDVNPRLVQTYRALRDNPENVIDTLLSFPKKKEAYYSIRKTTFKHEFESAAQFIYLNQLCFNGLYRVNRKGEFNVPFGNRENHEFNVPNLRAVSRSLKNVEIYDRDFEACLKDIGAGDLVFLDPPYTVSHNNNGFITYNEKLFSMSDQDRLSKFIGEVIRKNAFFILTNAAHDTIREMFGGHGKVHEFSRPSLIAARNANRGKFAELFITNIES